MKNINDYLVDLKESKEAVREAAFKHRESQRSLIRLVLDSPGLVEEYLMKNPSVAESIMRLAIKQNRI